LQAEEEKIQLKKAQNAPDPRKIDTNNTEEDDMLGVAIGFNNQAVLELK